MSDEPPGGATADDAAAAPPAPPTAPPRQRSTSRMWEAIVGVSTAAGVVVALVVGLPNLLHHDPPAAGTPTPAVASASATPSAVAPSIEVLSPGYAQRVTVTCVGTACAIEVRGRTHSATPGLHAYVLIARECCLDAAPAFYVQWDSTNAGPDGDWTARAYVARPDVEAVFRVKAVLTTQAVRPAGGADDLIVWSDSMARKFGQVAQSDSVTVTVARVVSASAFCTC
ncbi:hypothetical protein [Hamadaea tsunoensis]|uniref:hypothetical protein n=1 Tax=Hamadaea tsunoensis TaxID=53368 RepID=UPI0003F4EE8C|nr:hypothetical protein [Hamadaea tsunoensis]